MYIKPIKNYGQRYESSELWASQILRLAREWTSSAQKLQTKYKFKNYMHIMSVNDEQRYGSSGLWPPRILSLARVWKSSAHELQNKLQV
jgi:hypothetical protein